MYNLLIKDLIVEMLVARITMPSDATLNFLLDVWRIVRLPKQPYTQYHHRN